MDEVTRFLTDEGLHPTPKYFSDSDFLLGQFIDTGQFQLIYRLEGERLVLCDFAAKENDGQAVHALIALLRRLSRSIPVLRYIDAMILSIPQDPKLNKVRQRLAHLILSEGAKPIQIEDELWLRYHC